MKQPGQHQGDVVDYPVEIIDVLPTIADVLGIAMPWRIDGLSAFQNPRRESVRVERRREAADGLAAAFVAAAMKKHMESVRRKAALSASAIGRDSSPAARTATW